MLTVSAWSRAPIGSPHRAVPDDDVPIPDDSGEERVRKCAKPQPERSFVAPAHGTSLAVEAGMDALLQDVKYAVRGFVKAPGFTAVALLTLALGTGANATVFSFVNALLLRPAPVVADPSRLVAVYTSDFSSGPYGDSSYLDYLSLREEATAFASLAAYREGAPV